MSPKVPEATWAPITALAEILLNLGEAAPISHLAENSKCDPDKLKFSLSGDGSAKGTSFLAVLGVRSEIEPDLRCPSSGRDRLAQECTEHLSPIRRERQTWADLFAAVPNRTRVDRFRLTSVEVAPKCAGVARNWPQWLPNWWASPEVGRHRLETDHNRQIRRIYEPRPGWARFGPVN